MAWRLLTEVWGLPKERLYVTYFGGDERYGLPADLEARQLWIDIGFEAERVLPFGMKENFWEMGESGPCGPCSEIHFDRLGGRNVAHLVNMDDPDVLEIWNLVFMQYNREADGSLRPLPNKHVDTGAGLERVVSVLQDKRSNYDTDVFAGIFAAIQEGTGVRAYTGKVGRTADLDGVDMAYRVVADHIRTLTIAISDGGLPSNEGRGYVLRRILRRAIRYAHEKLQARPGFFATLVDVVVAGMGDAFPELRRDPEGVKQVLLEEEAQFRKTLDRGLVQFAKFAGRAVDGVIAGEDAWRLYDTYGFPVDLTRLMAEEAGLRIDEAGFAAAQDTARLVSKQGKADGVEDPFAALSIDVHLMAELGQAGLPVTDDAPKYTEPTLESKVLAIIVPGPARGDSVSGEDKVCGLLLSRTNFYAEQGGQLFDTGAITGADGQADFRVESVQVYGGYVLHLGRLKYGSVRTGDAVVCAFDELRRRPMRQNHTATHLLNFALRQVIPEADQRGSLVAPDRLRFDYATKAQPTLEQLAQIEAIVNGIVAKAHPVQVRSVDLDAAMAITGLRAVFGEVYPNPVRVISVGPADLAGAILSDPMNPAWMEQSLELCGGTHCSRSSDIRAFVIVAEQNIAKGIRRIVAVTGDAAAKAKALEASLAAQLASCDEEGLKRFTRDLDDATISVQAKAALRARADDIKKAFVDAAKALSAAQTKTVADAIATTDAPFVCLRVDVGANGKALLAGLNALAKAGRSGLLYSVEACAEPRIHYHCVVAPVSGLDALALTKTFADALAGKCGGRPAAAMGSAPFTTDAALEAAAKLVLLEPALAKLSL
jgi:alanyl-tRNA synthetase